MDMLSFRSPLSFWIGLRWLMEIRCACQGTHSMQLGAGKPGKVSKEFFVFSNFRDFVLKKTFQKMQGIKFEGNRTNGKRSVCMVSKTV
jgi:hypothetical protein